MANRLQAFVKEHPEFFEKSDGYWSLSSDLRDLMDRYARAYNKEEYDKLRAMVDEVREKERDKLQKDIEKWTLEAVEEKKKAIQVDLHLRAVGHALNASEKRIVKSEIINKPKPGPSKNWYNSGGVFLLLALAGVSFIYLGIIVNEGASMSYLLGGVSCLIVGVYLQSGGASAQPVSQVVVVPHSTVVKQERSAMKVARIKRATLLERKRVANQTEASFNHEINRSIAKLNTLDG